MDSFKRPISLVIGVLGIVVYNLIFYLFAKQYKMSTGQRLGFLEFLRKRILIVCFSLAITVIIVYFKAGPFILQVISDVIGRQLNWNPYLYCFIGVLVEASYSAWKKRYSKDI